MNVFVELFYAIKSPDTYKEFLKNRGGKVFGVAVLLMLFYFLLSIVGPFAKFQLITGGFEQIVEQYVPEFRLTDGEFEMEKPVMLDQSGVYVDINTDPDMLLDDINLRNPEILKILNSHSSVFIADREKGILKSEGETQTFYFDEFSDFNISRDIIMKYIPMLNVIIVIGMIFLFLWETALFFFGVLSLSLVGLIINTVVKSGLTFGQIYLMGIYSRTLPLLIKGLLKLFGVHIPMFWMINFGISVIYLCLAFQKYRDYQARLQEESAAYGQYGDGEPDEFR